MSPQVTSIQRSRAKTAWLVLAAVLALTAAVLVTNAAATLDPTRWNLARLGSFTYLIAGGFAFLEVGTPLGLITPSELAVPFAGAAAAAGAVGLLPLIGIVWLCATVGDSVGFCTGRLAGDRFFARIRRRRPRAARHHDALSAHFDRHGVTTVLIGRWLPYARTATPLMAGASHMRYLRFLSASAIGSGIWSAVMCSLGYTAYRSVDTATQWLGRVGLVALGLAVTTLLLRRRARRRRGA